MALRYIGGVREEIHKAGAVLVAEFDTSGRGWAKFRIVYIYR